MNLRTYSKGDNRLREVVTVTDTANEPVTLAELKDFLDLDSDYDSEDVELTNLISAAREILEKQINRTLKTAKTLTAYFDEHGSKVDLPYSPIQSISSVKTISPTNDETTLTADSDYYLKGGAEKYLYIPFSTGYELQVTYIAGYDIMPDAVDLAIKQQCYAWYFGECGDSVCSNKALKTLSYFSKNLWL